MIRLQISRTLGKDNWNIDDFRKCINSEISARESFEYLKKSDEPGRSTSSLTLMRNQRKSIRLCIFCGDKNHYSDKCDVITEVGLRKDKLKELRCCFRFMRRDHLSRNCGI